MLVSWYCWKSRGVNRKRDAPRVRTRFTPGRTLLRRPHRPRARPFRLSTLLTSTVTWQPAGAATKSVIYVPEQMLPYVAVRGQPKAIGESQNQNPPFHKFPAYGVFLLKRPKGTKSRRWARGLFYAWRELLHGTHPIRCPANHGGNRNLERDGKTRPALVVLSRGIVLENGGVSWG